MIIQPNDRILFTGDSITDGGRNREDAKSLGVGYPLFITARLQAYLASPELQIFNRGISGNRTSDLLARIEPDLLALKPTVISIMIGINDVWRRYDQNNPTTVEAYEKNYRTILEKIDTQLKAQVVLLEPFLLHIPEDRYAWREDLNPKIDVVRKLALEFGAELIPLDGLFAKVAMQEAPPAYWAWDGVHPSDAGHGLIAEAWLENADLA